MATLYLEIQFIMCLEIQRGYNIGTSKQISTELPTWRAIGKIIFGNPIINQLKLYLDFQIMHSHGIYERKQPEFLFRNFFLFGNLKNQTDTDTK